MALKVYTHTVKFLKIGYLEYIIMKWLRKVFHQPTIKQTDEAHIHT